MKFFRRHFRPVDAFRCLAAVIFLFALTATDLPAFAAREAPAVGPRIRSAAEVDYPPFSIAGEDGRADGFSVEMLRAALGAMGREVTFRTGPWVEVRSWLENGEIDALPLVGRTPEREALFDFTFPYMSLHGAIVVRRGSDIRGLADLEGRQVAVMKGDNAEEFLRRRGGGIHIHPKPTFDAALRELSEGRHDALVIQRLVALRLIRQAGLSNLHVLNKPVEGFRQDFCFAVREGDRETLALLNEGLSLVMADGTFRHLHAKWFAALELPTQRKIIVGGDHNYPPFEYLDEAGKPAGFNVAITRAIARAVGIEVDIRLGPWAEIRRQLEEGQIDAIQGMLYSPRRDLTYDFTPSYTVNHYVSVVRKEEGPPPATVEELKQRRISVQRGDIMHEFALERGLEDRIVLFDAQKDALQALAEGKADCALAARLTALYWIEKRGWDNLVLADRAFLSPGYGFAVPHNQKALLAQFSEGLKLIEETGEYQLIREQWLGIYEEPAFAFSQVLKYAALVGLPLLLVLLGFFLWNRSLRKEVASRTERLKETAAILQAAMDCSTAGIAIADAPDGALRYVNEAGLQIRGGTQEEHVTGVGTDQYSERWQIRHFDGTPFEENEIPLARAVKYGERCDRHFLIRRGDEDRVIWANAAPIRDDRGSVIAGIVVFTDITELKKAEEEVRKSEEKFRLLVESSPDAIFVQTRWRFAYLNESAVRLFGAESPADLLGTAVTDRFHPDDHEAIRRRIRRLNIEKKQVPLREEAILRLDGGPVHVEVSAVPIHYEGEDGALVFVRDISERIDREKAHRQLQDQLLQSQKLESIGRLAGGVAHDYNNMLNVIIGYAEMGLERVDPKSDLHRDLTEILSAARRSSDITRQLLAFARRQTIAPKVVDLNESIEAMLKMLRRLIGENIDLLWMPAQTVWPVKMDPAQLDQILANLCINARDAIEAAGKITIETGAVTIDEAYCAEHAGFMPGSYTTLAVSDDGKGMDAKTLENLFEPFFTTKETDKGTGLGLATVYGIVKQNDGFINVYSEPGQGTTFRIYLPRYAGAVQAESKKPETESVAGLGETVLVVEDEKSILNLTRKMLEHLGYQVLAAASPSAAVELAETHGETIHLLLTDVVMPEMSGRDLSVRLRQLYPGIQTLYMSGYTANVIAHRGVLDEDVSFINKPFSKAELGKKIREALEKQKP